MKNRIKELRIRAGLNQTQLATRIGVSQGTLSYWENEKFDIDNESLKKIARIFSCSTDYLLYCSDDPRVGSRKNNTIPVYGNVAAGIPIEAITDVDDYEEIDEALAASGQFIALRIHGDSMEPKMSDGDVVIVRLQDDCESGDTAVVMINGDSATCKKIKKIPEGIFLISTNPAYEPMFYSNTQIERLPVRILGRVVELRSKF